MARRDNRPAWMTKAEGAGEAPPAKEKPPTLAPKPESDEEEKRGKVSSSSHEASRFSRLANLQNCVLRRRIKRAASEVATGARNGTAGGEKPFPSSHPPKQ